MNGPYSPTCYVAWKCGKCGKILNYKNARQSSVFEININEDDTHKDCGGKLSYIGDDTGVAYY